MSQTMTAFQTYLKQIQRSFHKVTKLEFLNPDNSVAFSMDGTYKRGYGGYHDSRAFVSGGTLNVSLQNGQRRNASITLSNLDGAFDYNVNNLWFGRRVRLLMGCVLPDGTEYYIPQGVFYIDSPNGSISHNSNTITYSLLDKWSYLDGTLFGNLPVTFTINQTTGGVTNNIYDMIVKCLHSSIYDFGETNNPIEYIDNVPPIFTKWYVGETYTDAGGNTHNILDMPYDVSSTSTMADVILELNTMLAGLIGYDATGALRIDPSEEDLNDLEKPLLWSFTSNNSFLSSISETSKNREVFNDVVIAGESLDDNEIWGRATNIDPASDTNINIIGYRTIREERAEYWNADQCVALAKYLLKRKTILRKSITIQSQQMFHLRENELISVQRTDKPGSPVEYHVIQSFSLPIGDHGTMSINATSIADDINGIKTSSSQSVGG